MERSYTVKAMSNYQSPDKANKEFDLTLLMAPDLSTDTHAYVYGHRVDGHQWWGEKIKQGLRKIKTNKQGRYIEVSHGCHFKKVRVYL